MERISLDGEWELFYQPQDDSSLRGPADLAASTLQPVPAQVPGNVELDLVRAGLLPEPFEAANIHLLRRYEGHEWWYRRTFRLPETPSDPHWRLVFEGLDTFADIWLNGLHLGQTANMLIPHDFSADTCLRWGEVNEIVVRLGSAMRYAAQQTYEANQISWEQRWEALRVRKAPHVWGWDIMPRAVSAGIWRSVYLEALPADRFDWIYYWTRQAGPLGAVLSTRFQVQTAAADRSNLRITFDGVCGEHTFHHEWPLEFGAGGCNIEIPGAKLWWPYGYGEPNLYEITASLYRGDQLLARRSDHIGLRTVEVEYSETAGPDREHEVYSSLPARWDQPADAQHHFLVRVNGQPILVKGSNWVPMDAFHSRDAQRIEPAMEMANDLGINMIRCWGGNVYEHDDFYDQCDRRGILVWQDMAFACAAYPQDEEFLKGVRAEMAKVIPRLRNHACLALWCGDNENDMLYLIENLDPATNRLTREVIPQMLQRLDPHRAYLPGSPYHSPAAVKQKGSSTPEQHLWGPRGYFKSSFYIQHTAHFIGEIGYHGCPVPSSIARFISPEALWPWQNNDEWQVHAVYHWQNSAIERDRIQLMANQIRELFGAIPARLPEFSLASQISQAEAKKFFIESTRLRKWGTSGLIWWNLVDGWPQFSDAIVDYYYAKKLAYHYIRRAQAPIGLVIGESGSGKYLPLVACNDSLQDAEITFRAWEAGSQELLAEGRAAIPANQNWQVGRIRTFASDQRLILLEWSANGQVFGNHYLSGTPPFRFEQYRSWLEEIARLPRPFDPTSLTH